MKVDLGAEVYTSDLIYYVKNAFKNAFVAFGDDHIGSICEEYKHIINQFTYGEAMSRLGFTYTAADKTSELIKGHRTIDQVSFLKRMWVKYKEFPGVYFAPLEMETILTMPYWMNDDAPPGTLEDIIDTMVMELAANGFDKFRKYANTMNAQCLKKIGYRCSLLPITDDESECYSKWKQACHKFLHIDKEYCS